MDISCYFIDLTPQDERAKHVVNNMANRSGSTAAGVILEFYYLVLTIQFIVFNVDILKFKLVYKL